MDEGDRDQLIVRAARALAPMPAASPLAIARIVTAVRTRRASPPSRLALALEWMREPTLSVASAGLLAAAALVLGFVTHGALKALDESGGTTMSVLPEPPGAVPAQPAVSGGVNGVAVPIVFEARDAKSVSIVGDFNKWDTTASPMKRFGRDGPWTITVRATPGRHVYAFLVDGTTLVADPRAPRARDLDYGGDASVLMVTTP